VKSAIEKRRNPREMCSDFVQVTWLDDRERRISTLGLLEDVSPEGICLSLELPVSTGRGVHVHTRGIEGEAKVRYCELGDCGYGYVIGLEFSNGCSWNRDKWQPKHLFAPSVMT
jgi:hypothetical protein